jgi:hypothetical protein
VSGLWIFEVPLPGLVVERLLVWADSLAEARRIAREWFEEHEREDEA